MTVSERRNYQVAILFSIIIHLSLILIVFPMQLLSLPSGPSGVEEIAVGMYEFDDTESELPNTGTDPVIVVKPDKIEAKPIASSTKPIVKMNPKPKKGQPDQNSKPADNLSKTPISFGDGMGMVIGFGQKPTYPKNALNEGAEGEVLVRVLIKKDGSIGNTELLKRSGDSRLDEAAVKSLKREWVFKPNTEDYFIDIKFEFIDYDTDYKLLNSATRP